MSYLDIYGENVSPEIVSTPQVESIRDITNTLSSGVSPDVSPDVSSQTTSFAEYLPSFNTSMIILIIFALIGLIYVGYLFRDVIYGTIEEVLIYFGLMKEQDLPLISEKVPEKKKTEKGKYCIIGKNESGGVICVPYTNHRDCQSNDFALEADCVNL